MLRQKDELGHCAGESICVRRERLVDERISPARVVRMVEGSTDGCQPIPPSSACDARWERPGVDAEGVEEAQR